MGKMKNKFKKLGKNLYIFIFMLVVIAALFVLFSNVYVRLGVKDDIISEEQARELKDFDCIIVLGCSVRPNGAPSSMLNDRLDTGIKAYKFGAAPKIIMSGDHGTEEYDEVNTMKKYAIEHNVPSSDIFMDHAGFSTYDSIYRANEIFGAKKILIVSQEYHLYRAIFIAKRLGMEAYGLNADLREYKNQLFRDVREVAAISKDYVKCIYFPEAERMGEKISLKGSGDITNDK